MSHTLFTIKLNKLNTHIYCFTFPKCFLYAYGTLACVTHGGHVHSEVVRALGRTRDTPTLEHEDARHTHDTRTRVRVDYGVPHILLTIVGGGGGELIHIGAPVGDHILSADVEIEGYQTQFSLHQGAKRLIMSVLVINL